MRLFFALWPDEEIRRQLAEAAEGLDLPEGRRVPARNLHLTLVFLGQVEDALAARLMDGAGGVSGTPFALDFDHAGSFRGSGVAWLAPAECPPELLDLVARLRDLSTRCGIATEDRPYRPHLTIARKLKRGLRPAEFPSIHWQINSFCLVQSDPGEAGSEYTIRQVWPLK
jgi:2'-5' RNA ligase